MEDQNCVQKQFSTYCSKVIMNELIDYKRSINRHKKKTVNFSDLSLSKMNELTCQDTYDLFKSCLVSSKLQVYIENEFLHSALHKLRSKDCDVIILAYWLDMNDTEISTSLNIPRRTVTDIRHRSLKILKKYMEENPNDSSY